MNQDQEEFILKYSLTPEQELKRKLKLAKHDWIITDMFPTEESKNVSIYKAWHLGYKFAWDLIEKYL